MGGSQSSAAEQAVITERLRAEQAEKHRKEAAERDANLREAAAERAKREAEGRKKYEEARKAEAARVAEMEGAIKQMRTEKEKTEAEIRRVEEKIRKVLENEVYYLANYVRWLVRHMSDHGEADALWNRDDEKLWRLENLSNRVSRERTIDAMGENLPQLRAAVAEQAVLIQKFFDDEMGGSWTELDEWNDLKADAALKAEMSNSALRDLVTLRATKARLKALVGDR